MDHTDMNGSLFHNNWYTSQRVAVSFEQTSLAIPSFNSADRYISDALRYHQTSDRKPTSSDNVPAPEDSLITLTPSAFCPWAGVLASIVIVTAIFNMTQVAIHVIGHIIDYITDL